MPCKNWKTMTFVLLVALVAATAGFAQTAPSTRVPLVVSINGQLVNAAIVVSAAGTAQAFVCPTPQPYVTSDGKQGWACFDPATGVFLLGALSPPAPPVMAAAPPPAASIPPSAPPSNSVDDFSAGSAGSGESIVEQQPTQEPPRVIYVELPPRTIYVEAPPQIIYVQPPPPPAPEVIYVQAPPQVIVVERPVGRRGDRVVDEVVEPLGFGVAPVYTNSPAYVSRPAFTNPALAAPATDGNRRGDVDRNGRGDAGTGRGTANNNAAAEAAGQRGTPADPRDRTDGAQRGR